MKRLVCILLLASFMLSASDWGDPLFLADEPIVYGHDRFTSRISELSEHRAPLGLVLSGGSARAFSHIGVLEYLESIGIVPDFIVSNSMGSIVGLLYGAGFSPDQIYRLISGFAGNDLFSLVLPIQGGLLDASGFLSLIALGAGDLRVEDLHIPVLVLSEDLKTKRPVYISEGDFIQVMKASYALPVYFNPVRYQDHLLIDGGITNLVPIAAGKSYADALIVSTAFYQNPNLNLRNPLTVLNVAIDIGKTRQGIVEMKENEHILIRSDVEHFSFMDFDQIEAIRLAGFDSAEQQIDLEEFPLKYSVSSGDMGVTEELMFLREQYEQRISEIPTRISQHGEIPRKDAVFRLRPVLELYGQPSSRLYLRDEAAAVLSAELFYQSFRTGIFGGGMWDFTKGDIYAAAGAEASLFLGPFLSIHTGVQYHAESRIYGYGTAEGYFQAAPGLRLHAGGGIETQQDWISKAGLTLVTGWTGLQAELPWNLMVSKEAGGQLRDFSETHLFGEAGLNWGIVPEISLEQRLLWKYGLDGSQVPLYSRDDIRTTGVSPDDRMTVHTFRGVYHIKQFRPSFGEIIILKDVHAGVYGELGFYDVTAWSAGITAGARLSLIGLEELSFRVELGYDSSRQSAGLFFTLNP